MRPDSAAAGLIAGWNAAVLIGIALCVVGAVVVLALRRAEDAWRAASPRGLPAPSRVSWRPRGHGRSSPEFPSDAVSDLLNARSRWSASSSTLPLPRRACVIAR